MNIFHDRFSTGQVVQAAGVSNAVLQSWLKRDLIVGHRQAPISGGGSSGIHRGFSFFNVMEIAIAKGLVNLGLGDLKGTIFPAACRFAHSSGGAIGLDNGRLPSVPYNSLREPCFTMLCVAGDRSITYRWKADDKGFYPIVRHMLASPTGFTTLHINPIFEMVVGGLGYDYRDVLEFAYGATVEAID